MRPTRTLLGGVLVAVVVTAAFQLPVVSEHLPVRPLRLLRLAGAAGAAPAGRLPRLRPGGVHREDQLEVVRHGRRSTAGIVAVPLLAGSDRVVAAFANAVSLAPGAFVLQIDRAGEVCYVYQLGMRATDAERVRREVLALQRRVIAALGTPGELAAVDARLKAAR
ncbi:MAG: Na+/H+ antiporter subunit E [Pseudonocardiaceae bacterium]